ncbi:MAG: hypothetical protein HQ553_04585 [Chloroflexi bacterium]|nr:hypothetical protein [Chloroflexota bacterium]
MKQISIIIVICLSIITIATMLSCSDGSNSHQDFETICSEPVEEPAPGILVYSGCQPPITIDRLATQRIELINNSHAKDVSWDVLRAFLMEDATNEETYSEEVACGEFAEKVHNNAESEGIKSAIAVINLKSTEPHALNAFNTIDKGLIYIDCTGPEREYEKAHSYLYDKVAYVSIGKELGFMSIGRKPVFSYDVYEFRKEMYKSNIWESVGIVQSVEIYW